MEFSEDDPALSQAEPKLRWKGSLSAGGGGGGGGFYEVPALSLQGKGTTHMVPNEPPS